MFEILGNESFQITRYLFFLKILKIYDTVSGKNCISIHDSQINFFNENVNIIIFKKYKA